MRKLAWVKDGSPCPSCKSENWEEIEISNEEATGGKLRCNDCGFEGDLFLY